MKNLRIIYDNAADRASSITATSNAGGAFPASNMRTEVKGQVHRSAGTTVIYTLTWPAGESISAIALPATNLSPTAQIQVHLRGDAANGLPVVSPQRYAAPGLNLGLWDWAAPLNSNAFAYGGVSKVAVFFERAYFAKFVDIVISDPANPAGYIECSRIVAGAYWEPTHNASYGAQLNHIDTSKSERTDAGDLVSDRGTRHETLSFDLQNMPEADRVHLTRLIRTAGSTRNIFLSLLPEAASNAAEQDYMIYGKRANSPMGFDFYNAFTHKIEMESW